MELGSPVILVSAFGRGHWLAAALAKEGIKTTLIDVSAHLGVWPAEDVEGPFGFFRTENTNEMQQERLYVEDPFVEASNGFTIWFKNGPWEMKGPLTKFKIGQSKLSPHVKEFFIGDVSSKHTKALYRNLGSLDFESSWLLHFAHQWAGTTYAANSQSAEVGSPLPLFSSFFVRQATRQGLEKSLNWLKQQNVEVLRPQQVVDVSFSGKKMITGLELSGDPQGLFPLEQAVWLLTSEETYFLNERLGKYFFPEGALEPEWCWVRYRLSLESSFEVDNLPSHTVLIEDLGSPWTHENMIVLQRTSVSDQFDVWLRIPNVQRFNKEYLTMRSEKVRLLLLQRLPLANPLVLSFPQEYYYTYAQLGAARFPVFANKQQQRRGRSSFVNFYLDSPEVWPHYAHEAYCENQEGVRRKILTWWKEKLLKEQREKRKE